MMNTPTAKMFTYKEACEKINAMTDDVVFAKSVCDLVSAKTKVYTAENEETKMLNSVRDYAPPVLKIPVTEDIANKLWRSLAPIIRNFGGIVAGGFVSSFIRWNEKKIPGDIDVWIPDKSNFNCGMIPEKDWQMTNRYITGRKMPLNISYIVEYTHKRYNIKLQCIMTKEENPFNIIENFDYDVCKGVMSPGFDKDGNLIGVRATKPEIYEAIVSNTATYLERSWDIDPDSVPNKKAIERYRRYKAKGYEIVFDKRSIFNRELYESMLEKADTEKEDEAPYYCEKIDTESFRYISAEFHRAYWNRVGSSISDAETYNLIENLLREYEKRLGNVDLGSKYNSETMRYAIRTKFFEQAAKERCDKYLNTVYM